MVVNKIEQSINWLKSKLTGRQFQVLGATLVGLAAGVMAVVLKTLVHFIQSLFHTSQLFSPVKMPQMVFFPTLGIVLTVLFVAKILRGDLGKGVSDILFEIAQKSSFVKRHKLYSHVVTSALTVGLGGSAGLEAPIVITGSAVGSNMARAWHLDYRNRTLLLGCGAAAGIAAVFNAPIAGVMFAMEVLLADVTLSAFIPLIISAAVGALFSKVILNEETLFFFRLTEPFNYKNVPFYIVLAILSGFVSLYYVRISHMIGSFSKKITFSKTNSLTNNLLKALAGGVFLALLIYIFPSLFGEGYSSTKALADGQSEILLKNSLFSNARFEKWAIVFFILGIVFVKPIATSITLSSGGNGGNFAPSLFVGAHLGFVFARIINNLAWAKLPEGNFSIVGMAGILAGVMYAPLTGIFLIAEVTGGYELIIPLMIVATISSFLVRQFEPVSLEVKNLIARGEVFSRDKDRNILLLMKTSNLIEQDFGVITAHASLAEIVQVIKKSKRNLFAVVSKKGELEGILTLDDVREVMFEVKLYDKIFVEDIMKKPPSVLHVRESMSDVMRKFDTTDAWNLPVVEGNQYVGFISKSAIFSQYRSQLSALSDTDE